MNEEKAVQAPYHVVHMIGTLRTGGAEHQLINYLQAADRHSFRHTVICLTSPGELASRVEAMGYPVVHLRVRFRHIIPCLRRLVSWFRREDVVVIHTHMYGAAMWGRFAGKLAGVPVMVTTEHGQELWKKSTHLAVDRFLSKWTNRHIAVSQDGLDLRLRREGIAPDRIVLIPNGVPIPADPLNELARRRVRQGFGIGPDTPVIGTVGRLIKVKGYDHLLQALRILLNDVPDLRWLSVGDGDQRATLSKLAADLGVSDAVIWTGRRDDVSDLLAAMDVWVMSSVSEGLPVALLEAMGAQKPIIATRIGGIPDAVQDGREAWLVPPADPQSLADAIKTVLFDPALANRLSVAARHRAIADYSIDCVARHIEDIYHQELRAHR